MADTHQRDEARTFTGHGFHVMAKPCGPACNLACSYCFYLEKARLLAPAAHPRMSPEVLEAYVRSYIAGQPAGEVHFAWQGGEPLLLGTPFFEKAVELQKRFADGRTIRNSLQTNGTLLTDEWGGFLARHGFLVGVSIDGPRTLHDAYRVDAHGAGTFDRVFAGLELLRRHGVEFNTLTVVNRRNSREPAAVYRFLKEAGSRFLQFIPLVERQPGPAARELGLDYALPPGAGDDDDCPVTPWSVEPMAWGRFLCGVFDEWVRADVGSVFVQQFDNALGAWAGMGTSLCLYQETCGRAMIVEANGDVYSCDHYVYPAYRLGSVLETPLAELARLPAQAAFGAAKRDGLHPRCVACEYRAACHGECPKRRFLRTPDGEYGLNYLCAGYRHFFAHIDAPMRAMAGLLRAGQPPARIMERRQQQPPRPQPPRAGSPRPNDPCPCGSGAKFKRCCGARTR